MWWAANLLCLYTHGITSHPLNVNLIVWLFVEKSLKNIWEQIYKISKTRTKRAFILDFMTTDKDKSPTEWEVSDYNLIPFRIAEIQRTALTRNRSSSASEGQERNWLGQNIYVGKAVDSPFQCFKITLDILLVGDAKRKSWIWMQQ